MFFVRFRHPEIVRLMGFYREDLQTSRELGEDVRVSIRLRDSIHQRSVDLFYAS